MDYKDLTLQDAAISNQINLLRFTAGEKRKVLAILTQLQKDLRVKLLGDLTDFGKARANKLLKETAEAISTAYSRVQSELDFAGVAKQQATATAGSFAGIGLTAALPTEAALKALVNGSLIEGAPSAAWWAKQSDDLAFKFSAQVRQGIAGNETVQQIVRRVIGSPRLGTPGIMETSRRGAAALVHTSIQQVSNDARLATFKANDDVVQGVMQLSTLDSHTTNICIAYSGQSWDLEGNPINGSTLPFNGGTPRHWNAVAHGEMVTTSKGSSRIEDIVVGDLVLTHRNRFKPVTAVMSKLNESGFIRVINTESGRVIRVTDEHPVLTSDRGWLRADMLKAGDELFQHRDESMPVNIGLSITKGDADDNPSPGNAVNVLSAIGLFPGSVPLAIDFNDHHSSMEGEVTNGTAFNKLVLMGNAERRKVSREKSFSKRGIFEVAGLKLFHDAFNRAWKRCRVVILHPLRMSCIHWVRFFSQSISPMIFSGADPGCLQFGHIFPGSLSLCPGFDFMPLTPALNDGLANTEFSFDGAKGLSHNEMLFFDETFERDTISEINHFNTSIISDIKTVAYNGSVANIEVDEDQTFLVNGVVVHNCRSVLTAITRTYKELGIDIPEAPKGTRASDLGQIPADTSFKSFLGRHDAAYTDKLLGPGRAKLWKDGKITLQQLVGQTGRELTLKQLAAL